MSRWLPAVVGLLAFGGAGASPALACLLCSGAGGQPGVTLGQRAAQSRLVLYGSLANPRLADSGVGGTTEFHIEKILKPDPFVAGRKTLELPRYLPVLDPKKPPRFLIFCDVYKDKGQRDALDVTAGFPVESPGVMEYLRGLLKLDSRDRDGVLRFCFDRLDDPDPLVAGDAYAELARANDQEIGRVAGKLSASKLRRWLADPKTPESRLSLYAFLLGAAGGDGDAILLRSLLERPDGRTAGAIDGILSGYIRLRPREGWERVRAMLADERRPFPERFAALRAVRFYHAWKPDETRAEVLQSLRRTLGQGDFADLSVEDLRRWRLWDLTEDVLAQYGRKSHAAPIMRRTIVRYALSCPRPEARRFVERIRHEEPELVKEVEEGLQFEK